MYNMHVRVPGPCVYLIVTPAIPDSTHPSTLNQHGSKCSDSLSSGCTKACALMWVEHNEVEFGFNVVRDPQQL